MRKEPATYEDYIKQTVLLFQIYASVVDRLSASLSPAELAEIMLHGTPQVLIKEIIEAAEEIDADLFFTSSSILVMSARIAGHLKAKILARATTILLLPPHKIGPATGSDDHLKGDTSQVE